MFAPILLAALAAVPPAQRGQADKDQVAEAVEESFPAHDANANGRLSRAEFGAWMVELKARSDPKLKADALATRAWLTAQFRLADPDGNAGVTPAEFTRYLRQAKP